MIIITQMNITRVINIIMKRITMENTMTSITIIMINITAIIILCMSHCTSEVKILAWKHLTKSMMLSKFMMNLKEFIISIMVMVTMKKWNVLIIIMKNKNKGSHGLGRQKINSIKLSQNMVNAKNPSLFQKKIHKLSPIGLNMTNKDS